MFFFEVSINSVSPVLASQAARVIIMIGAAVVFGELVESVVMIIKMLRVIASMPSSIDIICVRFITVPVRAKENEVNSMMYVVVMKRSDKSGLLFRR